MNTDDEDTYVPDPRAWSLDPASEKRWKAIRRDRMRRETAEAETAEAETAEAETAEAETAEAAARAERARSLEIPWPSLGPGTAAIVFGILVLVLLLVFFMPGGR